MKHFWTTTATLVTLGFLGLAACCSTTQQPTPTAATKLPKGAVSGATLWAQACGHCHNIRSPDSYSDSQWDVAMLHMRVRATLTPEEHKQILTFLKSAH